MKRGLTPERIALAVASIIAIMTIFGTVLILSGRTVLVAGNAATTGPTIPNYMTPSNLAHSIFPYYMMPTVSEDSPCAILNCFKGKQPVFIGYETGFPEGHALCVCAEIRNGEAYYHDWEIKRISTERKY